MSEEFKQAELGSNTFINTDKLIYYETKKGKFVNLFELTKNNQDLMLTTKIRDENFNFLGKLNKNNFVPTTDKSLIAGRKFETKRIPNKFWLKDGDKILVCIKATNDDWLINGIFHIQVGKNKKMVRIEITDTETTILERVKREDPITKAEIMIFDKPVRFSSNTIIGMGGIKISGSKDDKGAEKDEGISISFGFHK